MSHEDHTHGPAPLGQVEPDPLHAAVDRVAALLHEYVDTAVGVRAEFGAAEADEDPRILALESRVGTLNAELYDALHGTLGMHPDLTSTVWSPDADLDEAVPDDDATDADVFYLGYVVGTPTGTTDGTLDGVMGIIDAAGSGIVQQLVDQGYHVGEWAVSRGEAPDFFEDDEEDDL
ncbi:hypothetical protein CLV28_0152 [Sediminihabitans luteus]|uniref:Uncharacterized protein n=1 Tax=Sediminihabitans luteus TaxID=1138585 RepID=A0A2M9CYF7_9CELL|nr:hypothetical protein [Sediminihabitans luteus]PJJ76940.1 hypothetical protein CLV28_0152 [Sediminihabitans luteus]GII99581.1 hypothetical protein Slu03_19590 [Sediminihabitans luteus]